MYIGLDLGTSGLRALLADEGGAIIATADAAYSVSTPHPGWSEQDPSDWVTACKTVMAALKAAHPVEFSALRGIGLSGHMHGATLVDAGGQVLRPCILWNDSRSAAQAAMLDQTANVRNLSGNIVFPGFTAPKLTWVEENEPEIFARVAKVLLPKDYLRYWLTGDYVGDMSDSAGTSWMDVGKREWSPELLEAGHMRLDQMPRLVEGSESSGTVRAQLRSDWGLAGPVTVAGGGGDNAVAACGVGCFRDGDGFVSLGTSGVLLAAKNSFAPAPETAVHTFCHAVPDTWYQMGVILAATDCLNWLSRILGRTPAELAGTMKAEISGPSRTMFLPYLSGERTPHNDSQIRGSFVGLDIATSPEDLTQAVMEGVSFALRDNLDALKTTGTNLSRILAIGGGAKSRFWLETLATTLDLPLDLPEKGDFGAALGAARLAIAADTNADLSMIMTTPKVAETVEPRSDLVDRYAETHARYRALYPNLKAALT
ncbi:xylulokinase [Parasedimentitalea psychrophila]|uniref:Xylulose kinase n=1 Tax=Parasedimentitalea psychrophila TaxID=2997337 RepID=A0A9Y2L4N6_9RHOB|nr:xylulokinase [Parasedimentitalea psychrophila]WIY27537.1 xylulokinase [Parasedimentitalea psychrophila]